jgi:hypothetical protein
MIPLSCFHNISFEINCETTLIYFQIATIVPRLVRQISNVTASLEDEATNVLNLRTEVSDKDEVIRCLQKEVEDLKLDPAMPHKRRRMLTCPEVGYKLIFESRLLHFYNLYS